MGIFLINWLWLYHKYLINDSFNETYDQIFLTTTYELALDPENVLLLIVKKAVRVSCPGERGHLNSK